MREPPIQPGSKELLERFRRYSRKNQQSDEKVVHIKGCNFDAIISKYPSMKHYLSPDSHIVHSPCFENAIVKSLNGSELSSEEMESIHSLQSDNPVEVTGGNESVADVFCPTRTLSKRQK